MVSTITPDIPINIAVTKKVFKGFFTCRDPHPRIIPIKTIALTACICKVNKNKPHPTILFLLFKIHIAAFAAITIPTYCLANEREETKKQHKKIKDSNFRHVNTICRSSSYQSVCKSSSYVNALIKSMKYHLLI